MQSQQSLLLTTKQVLFFELKHPSVLFHLTNGASLGCSHLPPVVTQRMNIFAEKSSTMFAGRPVHFVHVHLPALTNIEHYLQFIHDTIAWEATHPSKPFVWVIAPRTIISAMLGRMEIPDIGFYYKKAPQDHRWYEIYTEIAGKYTGSLIGEKHLFELN